METITVETRAHGRVLVEEPVGQPRGRLLVAFHGYAQSAEDILAEVRQIPGAADWRIVAVQALHRFYARDMQKVVASWMTREDRELAVADNVEYVDRVLDLLQEPAISVPRGAPPPLGRAAALEDSLRPPQRGCRVGDPGASREPPALPSLRALVFIGFSQGAAMAYRAARLGRHRASGVIALGGDIPPELKQQARDWPAVLIGAGAADQWYTAAKLESDIAFLAASDIRHDIVRFPEGHEWTASFRDAAREWLD